MKRAIAVLVLALCSLVLAAPAWAGEGTINWGGNGSDTLPCEGGGHWVLAPAFGIEGATLHVRFETLEYQVVSMTQSGQGSWSADSSGPIGAGVEAYVTYTGPGDERNHLQLSHCLGSEESPSPSPSPSETESPSPTPTETESPTPTQTSSSSTSTPPTSTPPTSRPSPPSTAQTGRDYRGPLAAGAALVVSGLGALLWARKRVV